jgi:hypothetical protein
MNEEKRFDDLLQSKLETDFPFDVNWEETEKIIKADEALRKRRRALIILFSSLALILATIVSIPLIKNSVSPHSLNNPASVPIAVKSPVIVPENKSTTSNSPAINKSTIVKPVAGNLSPVVNNNEPNSSIKSKLPVSGKSSVVSNPLPAVIGNKSHVYSTKTNPSVSGQSSGISHKPTNSSTKTSQYASIANTATLPKKQQMNSVSPGVLTANASGETAKSQVASILLSVVPDIDITTWTAGDNSNNSSLTSGLMSTPDFTGNIKNYGIPKNIFSIDAGVGYSLGWKSDNGTDANGFNYIIGIRYTHNFNKSWGFSLGVQYNQLTHVNAQYSGSIQRYDYGTYDSVNAVSVNTLHFLAFPLKVRYNLNNKYSFGFGPTFQYLITSTGTQTTYIITDNNYGKSYGSSSASGYTEGFNPLNVQLALEGSRKITGNLFISLELYYGLTDVEQNSFFHGSPAEQDKGIRLILNYNFLK